MCRAESSTGLDGGGVSNVESKAAVYKQPKATVLGGYRMGIRVRWLQRGWDPRTNLNKDGDLPVNRKTPCKFDE